MATSFDVGIQTPGVVTISASANSLLLESNGISRQVTNGSVQGQIIPGAPGTVVRNSAGSFSSTVLQGGRLYQSIVPDSFYLDSDPATGPFSGELLITAYDGSSVRLVAFSEFDV